MTAVFDLDGTLIDTAPDLLDAINVVLATDGLEAVSRDDLQKLVGHGGRVMIKSAYAQHGRTLDASDIDARIPTFIEAYSKSMPGQSTPYPGVMKLIAAMKADGWQVAICTNKMKQLADRLLASLEIDTVFHAVTGGDSFAFKKPDPRHIEETVNAVAGDPHNAVMFGDSENDIVAAQRADIPV
ncbi:MAG: HAD-IA family hydrolase, partial [Pseudomonadota bacterium]